MGPNASSATNETNERQPYRRHPSARACGASEHSPLHRAQSAHHLVRDLCPSASSHRRKASEFPQLRRTKNPASQKELLKLSSSEPQEDRNQSIQLPNSRGRSQKGTPKPRHRLNLPIHPAFAPVEDMNTKKLNETSKFLSYVLRHEPQAIGLQLDIEGWASIDELIDGAAKHGQSIDTPLIQAVVSSSDKKRFSISDDGLRIRAVQGHSTSEVSIQHTEKEPPEFLYHGTATRFLDSIWQQGLVAGSRHHVHLSSDVQTALAVGQRYGTPAILKIEALQMYKGGMKFYQADNGVWLTNHVPPERILKAD